MEYFIWKTDFNMHLQEEVCIYIVCSLEQAEDCVLSVWWVEEELL